MNDYRLSKTELQILHNRHSESHNKANADRIKSVYLLGSGWKAADIAQALLMDEQTIRRIYKRYQTHGIRGILESRGGSDAWLNNEQVRQLESCLHQMHFDTSQQGIDDRRLNVNFTIDATH